MYLKQTSDAQRKFDREYPGLLEELLKIASQMADIEGDLFNAFEAETGQKWPSTPETGAKIRALVEEWRNQEAYRSREEAKAQADTPET